MYQYTQYLCYVPIHTMSVLCTNTHNVCTMYQNTQCLYYVPIHTMSVLCTNTHNVCAMYQYTQCTMYQYTQCLYYVPIHTMSVLCTNTHNVVTLKSTNFISASEELSISEWKNRKGRGHLAAGLIVKQKWSCRTGVKIQLTEVLIVKRNWS
jgi:hypothetical protein